MTGEILVDYRRLETAADELQRMSEALGATAFLLAADVAEAGLPGLIPYGILGGVPVAGDLMSMCLPGTPQSLPDAAAELLMVSVAVRAAGTAYLAVDTLRWADHELPTARALLMLAAWNRLHQMVNLTALLTGQSRPVRGPAAWLDSGGEAVLDRADRWVEGNGTVHEIDPATMPPLAAAPADGLAALLGVVDSVSDARHPSTMALLRVSDHPPRYILCLPGLQDAAGADSAAADLPGALATLTGHSAYIRGAVSILTGLPPGSQVLLVGHSQGGMVAEAVGARGRVGNATISGVVTAGSPLLASSVPVPYLALENVSDPVPKLGALAGLGTLGSVSRGGSGRTLVKFRTAGPWPSGDKHGLGSGGYIAEAGSKNPRVQAFGKKMKQFFTHGQVPVRYLQVTDTNGI